MTEESSLPEEENVAWGRGPPGIMLVHACSREGGEGCGEPESVLFATVASQLCGLVASWERESPVLPDLPFCLSFFSCVYL